MYFWSKLPHPHTSTVSNICIEGGTFSKNKRNKGNRVQTFGIGCDDSRQHEVEKDHFYDCPNLANTGKKDRAME